MIARQRHAKLQAQRFLLRGGAVHQVLHLLEIGADAVEITVASLVQQRIADVTGVERGVAEEAVVILRVEVEPPEHIGRAEELFFIGEARARFTRRGAGLDAQQLIEIAKQRRIELAQAIQFRVNVDQVRAFRVIGNHKKTVVARRQRIRAGIDRFALRVRQRAAGDGRRARRRYACAGEARSIAKIRFTRFGGREVSQRAAACAVLQRTAAVDLLQRALKLIFPFWRIDSDRRATRQALFLHATANTLMAQSIQGWRLYSVAESICSC